MRYRTIVADPPWAYRNRDGGMLRPSKTHRPNSYMNPQAGMKPRYDVMEAFEIAALPVCKWVDDSAHLYLWTTNQMLCEAHQIAQAWGFAVKTVCTWGKVKPDGTASMKMGHWFRGATEHCLFCTRGQLRLSAGTAQPTLWLWPRLPHSVKPDAFYDLVEQVSPGPRLELFARRQRLGWDTWGDEALEHVEVA